MTDDLSFIMKLYACTQNDHESIYCIKKTANKVTVFNRMGKIIVLDGSVALLPEQQSLLFPFAWQLPSRHQLHPLEDHSG